MVADGLEQKITIKNNKDISRIFHTTTSSAMVGLVMPNPEITIPISAMVGFTISVYDETKKIGLDMAPIGVCSLLGCFFGSVFNNYEQYIDNYIPDSITYAGILLGAGIGTYSMIKNRKKQKSC